MFGGVPRYTPRPTPANPERVVVATGWVDEWMTEAEIPQLAALDTGGHRRTRITCHYRAAPIFRALFAAWEAAGLLPLLRTYDGCWVPRFKRGRAPGGPQALSNHTWGTAIDLNARELPLGTRPDDTHPISALVPIAEAHGVFWGGLFRTRPDPMHWEVARLDREYPPHPRG